MKIIRIILKEPIFNQLIETRDATNRILDGTNEKPIGGSRLVSLAISQQMYHQKEGENADILKWVEHYRELSDKERVMQRFELTDNPDFKDYLTCLVKSLNKTKKRDMPPISRDEVLCFILERYLPRILKKIEETHSSSQA